MRPLRKLEEMLEDSHEHLSNAEAVLWCIVLIILLLTVVPYCV